MSIFTPQKSLVRTHFTRAALTYDAAALVQREAGEQMFSRLEYMTIQPQRIVDLGSGTGFFSRKLAARYRQAQIIELDFAHAMLNLSQNRVKSWRRWMPGQKQHHYLCADMEALPLAAESVDLIWSNCALNWLDTPDRVFTECHRILTTEGLFMFCTLGPDTLQELREAFSMLDDHAHVHRFVDMHDVGDALIAHGFSAPVMDMEHITLTYDSVDQLLQDLKAMGAGNAMQGRIQGLMGKGRWQKMLARYNTLRRDGVLPATFELIYGHAWKGKEKTPVTEQPVRFYPARTQR